MRVRLYVMFTVPCAVETELRTGLAELGSQLRCCEDGELEDLGGSQQLLGRRDDFWEFVDCWAEFLLQVADAVRRREEDQLKS